jgi:hypothetical protein
MCVQTGNNDSCDIFKMCIQTGNNDSCDYFSSLFYKVVKGRLIGCKVDVKGQCREISVLKN